MSGIEGAIFVHNGGFVAYALDREAAVMVSVYGWIYRVCTTSPQHLKYGLKEDVFGSVRSSRNANVCSVCLFSESVLEVMIFIFLAQVSHTSVLCLSKVSWIPPCKTKPKILCTLSIFFSCQT